MISYALPVSIKRYKEYPKPITVCPDTKMQTTGGPHHWKKWEIVIYKYHKAHSYKPDIIYQPGLAKLNYGNDRNVAVVVNQPKVLQL